MASRADVARFVSAGRDVVTLAQEQLVAAWQGIDVADTITARQAAADAMVDLASTYGPIAALVAADFYDDLRAAAAETAGDAFQALLASSAPAEQVVKLTGWATGPLARTGGDGQANAEQALRQLAQGLQRMIMQPARDTIAESTAADPAKPRWARVPQGPTTCAFCLMLASRGPEYRTAAAATYQRDSKRHYHNDCDCVPTPVFVGDELPDGYDPGGLYELYREARRAARSGDTTKILAELRRIADVA